MTIKKLFLCHQRDAASEVHALAQVLRLHGIVPWVDQQGGFMLGDEQIGHARRIIREECFGLLLYATRKAFDSDFIRRVEMHEAVQAKDEDTSFVLAALPRQMGFGELSQRSLKAYGFNLASIATHALRTKRADDVDAVLEYHFANVAVDLLHNVLAQSATSQQGDVLQLQFSTRERLADAPGDVLCLDATQLLQQDTALTEGGWQRIDAGLRDVKHAIATCNGRPRLRVHGSKHLTAAFLFGYVFSSTVFELEIRTKHEYWSTDCDPTRHVALEVTSQGGSASSTALHVELSTLGYPIHGAVRRYLQRVGRMPLTTVWLTVDPTAYGGVMDNAAATAIAHQVRRELTRLVSTQPITELHLFAAVPQALAMMIGQRLNALPPVQLYEYDGREYYPSHRLAASERSPSRA